MPAKTSETVYMKGGGYYSRVNRGTRQVISNALDSFVRAYVSMLRSWSESTFYNGLDPSRPSDERNRILDLFYGKYEERVRRTPEEHAMDHVHCYMVISKADVP